VAVFVSENISLKLCRWSPTKSFENWKIFEKSYKNLYFWAPKKASKLREKSYPCLMLVKH